MGPLFMERRHDDHPLPDRLRTVGYCPDQAEQQPDEA
jgi:hypothetical protein